MEGLEVAVSRHVAWRRWARARAAALPAGGALGITLAWEFRREKGLGNSCGINVFGNPAGSTSSEIPWGRKILGSLTGKGLRNSRGKGLQLQRQEKGVGSSWENEAFGIPSGFGLTIPVGKGIRNSSGIHVRFSRCHAGRGLWNCRGKMG